MKNLKDSFAQYIRTIGYKPSTQSMMRYALKGFQEQHPNINQVSRKEIEVYAEYLSIRQLVSTFFDKVMSVVVSMFAVFVLDNNKV